MHYCTPSYEVVSQIVKYYYNFKNLCSIWIYFKMSFIPVMAKQPLLQFFSATESFRNHSNMLIYIYVLYV